MRTNTVYGTIVDKRKRDVPTQQTIDYHSKLVITANIDVIASDLFHNREFEIEQAANSAYEMVRGMLSQITVYRP